MYYTLDRKKRYGVEGLNNKVGSEILAYITLLFFWGITVAVTIINFNVLFKNTAFTASILIFIAVLSVFSALLFVEFLPVYKKRIKARKILKDCVLADGTVTAVYSQKLWHHGPKLNRNYSYYRVLAEYSFVGLNGAVQYGQHIGNYSEIPFYTGQNLMIAFNGADSVILNKFTLSEGAEEFAAAEEERGKVDYGGLTGKLIKVNRSASVKLAGYTFSFKATKRKKRLKQILKDNPRFTAGKFFIKNSTYRVDANNKFYCYITNGGIKRVEACAGIGGFNDGGEITVVYSGGCSEIIKINN